MLRGNPKIKTPSSVCDLRVISFGAWGICIDKLAACWCNMEYISVKVHCGDTH